MIAEALIWSSIDTWILLTASLVAASSAIPGCFLFLRKQSMIADALTHAALPGVVTAFVVAESLDDFRYGFNPNVKLSKRLPQSGPRFFAFGALLLRASLIGRGVEQIRFGIES